MPINLNGKKNDISGSKIIVYHGSNREISNPQIISSSFQKDFGFAFYCTQIEKQAIRRANSKAINNGIPIVSKYYFEPAESLKVKTFKEMTDAWLDFIINCRKGVPHSFDIVEGPMADDQIYNYIEDFESGVISRQAFWALAKFKYPTHQIAFCTSESLKALKFISAKHYEKENRQKNNQIKK